MLQNMIFTGIGLLASLLFFLLSKSKARLNYHTTKLQIIGNVSLKLPGDFEVTLSGERIESLHKSQLIIWNGGTSTINGTDITKDEPLKVVFDSGTKIFNVSLTGLTREINKFKATSSENTGNEVELTFDFLDKKDGVLIDVLHTESRLGPRIMGTIKGLDGIVNKGQIDYIDIKNQKKIKWKSYFLTIGIISIFSLILSGLFVTTAVSLGGIMEKYSTVIAVIVAFSSFFVTFLAIFIIKVYEPFKKKYPKHLKFKE
ncbi:hypothetical protein [Paenibacillus sp. FSL R7-0026]|uniref:hypothetical protein n=1 Tax=Paenibacillus sp. FSL R7-0026 TaxID=2921668 RepID=UPI0030F57452